MAGCLGFTVAVGAGCSSDDRSRDLSLLEKDRAKEEERLRQLQLVRVIDVSDPDHPNPLDVPASTILGAVDEECFHASGDDTCGSNIVEFASLDGCRARLLLAAALPQTSEMRVGQFVIPIQTPAANAALAIQAADFAQASAATVKGFMDDLLTTGQPPDPNDDFGCALGTGETPIVIGSENSRLEILTALFAEFYEIESEAMDTAVQSIIAVADSQLGSSPSFDEALARVFSGSALSRAAAAHLLAGGAPGLNGDTAQSFCKDRLTPDVRAAVGVFRDAAIAPAALDPNGPPIEALLNGSGAEVAGGSVRQRLGEFYGFTSLLAGRPVTAHFGISQETFQRARLYMVDEMNALGRSRTAVLDPRITPSGAASTFDRFVGTASDPLDPPSDLYAAIVRRALTQTSSPAIEWPQDYQGEAASLPNLYYGTLQPHAHFTDAVMTQAASWLNDMNSLPTAEIRKRAQAPLALLLASEVRPGRLTIKPSGSSAAAVIVQGFDRNAGLLLAIGDDALRCATIGNIEGAPCRLDASHGGVAPPPMAGGSTQERNTVQVLPIDQPSTPAQGFATSALGTFAAASLPPGRAYLLRPKAGMPRTAGNYESVLGITQGTGPAQFTTRSFPITPLLDRRVDELVAPSRKWCAMPAISCSGASFDERLPLDDELATEQPGVEKSWKHFLNLARDAAERADQLGVDYINSGLSSLERKESLELRTEQQRERADDEMAKLQSICGTQVDPRKLLKQLSATPRLTLDGVTDGPAASDGSCAKTTFKSQGGTCVVDTAKFARSVTTDPDLQRIADCLGDSNAVTASLGVLSLCFWKRTDNPHIVCEESPGKFAEPGTRCPIVRPAAKDNQPAPSCQSLLTPPPGNTVDETFALQYFDNTVDDGFDADRCRSIRAIRNDPTKFEEKIQNIFTRNWLNGIFLRQVADRLAIEYRYDPKSLDASGQHLDPRFVAIMRDQGTRFETGSTVNGPSTQGWPCGTPDPSCDCDPNQPSQAGRVKACSMFCRFGNCADLAQRSQFNDLLVRSVVAAKALTVGTADEKFSIMSALVEQLLTSGPKVEILRAYTDEPVVQQTNPSGYKSFALAIPGAKTANFVSYPAFNFRVTASAIGSFEVNLGPVSVIPKIPFFDKRKWIEDALTKQDGFATVDVKFAPNTGSNAINPVNPPPGFHLDGDDLLNGFELLCDGAEPPKVVSLNSPPVVRSVADLSAVSQYVKVLANTIRERASLSMFFDVPRIALDGLREQSSVGAFPKFAGQYGEQLSALRGALLRIRESGPLLASEVEQFGQDVEELRLQLEKNKIAQDLSKLKFAATLSQQLANCATGISSISISSPLSGLGAAASCANSVAQINFAAGISELERMSAQLDSDLAISNFGATFASRSTNLQLQALRLSEAQEDFDRALQERDRLRSEARASLARAMQLASFQAESEAALSSVVGNIFDGKQRRYMAALENAKRVSFLAKRAIEQRLGVRLADMDQDLPLVDAPAKWEGSVCTFTGVSFDNLKSASPNAAQSFASSFISDYVTKLSNVVESYRLVNSFHEGTDTAVISLRDDLMNVRAQCDSASGNLFFNAGQLDGPTSPGWALDGCPTEVAGDADVPVTNCIRITRLEGDAPPFLDTSVTRANGYQLAFGPPGGADGGAADGGPKDAGPDGQAAASPALVQAVDLKAGRYRLSWYTKEGLDGTMTPVGGASAEVFRAPVPIEIVETSRETAPPVDGGIDSGPDGSAAAGVWNREFRVFILRQPAVVQIGFGVPRKAGPRTTVAAPMLELLPSDGTKLAPTPFINTTDKLALPLPVCEDTSGDVFRVTRWNRRCLRLCPDGFSNDCSGERAQTHCFQEASFSISQRDIQLGKVMNFSGFARGNFNYRIESIGLNFVGTSTRDCTDAQLPSTCFGAAFIPYTIEHNGPFYVRNHQGADVESLLFDGRIEHARGLASERYLTNPLSSADEMLMGQYLREELIGRPLDGNFVIRVWEEPGVNFDAINDVQVVLKYRYWTKFR
jgi:hypothetical protein